MDLLLSNDNKKEIREYEKIIAKIIQYRKELVTLSNEELKSKTALFKERLQQGEGLDDILEEAFAVAREASRRFLGKEPREVQLMGAIALHRGDVAEMKTGEGKTLTAPLAAYLNALSGKSVHIATANDYLATRDSYEMRPLFEGLGLTVGVVTEARESDKTKEIEKRKEAYASDITYGSSNAFAFDYLRDNTAKSSEEVVRNDDNVGFIIIDEVDQILINDAVMPFKLSGGTKEKEEKINIDELLLAEQKRQYLEQLERQSYDASAFVGMLFDRYNEELKEYREAKQKAMLMFGKDSVEYRQYIRDLKQQNPLSCGAFMNVEDMMLHQGGDKDLTNSSQSKYSVLFCKGQAASLTEKGWLEAFNYFKGSEIQLYLNSNVDVIRNNEIFVIDEDYTYDGYELSFTTKGLEKAVKHIPEIKDLNNAFYSESSFSGLNKAIENALKAHFVLEKGKDYVLQDTFSNRGIKKKVLLVSNGRTAEGRVYSDGLQQAIEMKETRLNSDIRIENTTEQDELASISQKAFYSIYPKVSGMTGTSSKEIFENIYGMDTVSIPKHSEYNVSDDELERIYSGREDKETVIFATDQDKLDAVVLSAIKSREKGQPVLIGTLSVNESQMLYQAFVSRGIKCNVLNAENLEEEAEIIASAGLRGSITISTQMAGRGTDIKLGGELSDAIAREKEEIVTQMLAKLGDNKEEVRARAMKMIEEQKMDIVVSRAIAKLDKERRELSELGGLKVIGYGHYPTRRDDDQLRGRAARQSDPGVTEFYASVTDLRKHLDVSAESLVDALSKTLKVNKATIRKDLARRKEITGLGKEGVSSEEITKLINTSQKNNEANLSVFISSTQEADYNLSIMRKKVYEQRKRMLDGEETKENMLYIIDSTIINLIARNLPQDKYFDHKDKIRSSSLNINNFIIDVEEVLGIDLSEMFEENEFRRLGDIEKFLHQEMKEKYLTIREKNGDEVQDKIDRENIISTLDDGWRDFNENLDYIKYQHSLSTMAQNKEYNEIFAMKMGFNSCMVNAKTSMIAKVFGKPTIKSRKEETESIEIEEDINDYSVYNKKSYTNLSVRPAKLMSVFFEKLKVVKDKIKYQFELVPIDNSKEEEVEQMKFDDSGSKQELNHLSTKK